MKQFSLRYTFFHVEKLMNVVGIGRSCAYQVITTPGKVIGLLGPVANPANIVACNESYIAQNSAVRTLKVQTGAWVRRSLAVLGF